MRVRRVSWLWASLVLVSLAVLAGAQPNNTDHEWVGPDGPAFMRAQLPGGAPDVGIRTVGTRQATEPPTADRDITQSPSENVDPVWSPDAARIAFASNRAGSYDIYIARPDGSHPDTGAALTPKLFSGQPGDERYPAWSPGGMDIAYLRGNAIYVRNLRTNVEIRLIDGLAQAQGLTYSGDGARLVFSARLAGDADLNLYWVSTDPSVIDPATGRPQMVRITNAPGNEVNPTWFPNSSGTDPRQILFASNTGGDYDIYRVAPPTVGAPPTTFGAADRVVGGTGDQMYPGWVRNALPGAVEPYYVVYADNTNGDFDVMVLNPDQNPTPEVVYAGAGDQIQPVASPYQSGVIHNQLIYSGKRGAGARAQLYLIDMYDVSPPILSNGVTTVLPQVTPQRAFGGATVTVTAAIFDRGSGVAPAPIDHDGDGIYDSGVWALFRLADRPVYSRMDWTSRNTAPVTNSGHYTTSMNQIEMDQMVVDVPGSAGGLLSMVNPMNPALFNVSRVGRDQYFSKEDALAFVQTYGLAMYDDGTHGDATAGDGIYTGQWQTPADPQDYYVDIVPVDLRANLPLDTDLGSRSGYNRNPLGFNWLEGNANYPFPPSMRPYALGYDKVAGFTTRQLDVTRRVLFVSDYGAGQKFLAADFSSPDLAALNRYWPIVLPTEHYWFGDDDNPGADSPTGHPLFVNIGNNPPAITAVHRTAWGAFSLAWPGTAGSLMPLSSLPDQRLTSPYAFETQNGAPFGGPTQHDRMAIWRILSRGAVDTGTLGYYTPLALPATEGNPRPLHADGMVVWTAPYLGNVFAQPGTLLDAGTQGTLRGFVAAGGGLLVTGQDIAWALTKNGTQMSPFLQEVLGANFLSDMPQAVTENAIYGPMGPWPGDRNALTAVSGASATETAMFQFIGAVNGVVNPIHNTLTLRNYNDGGIHTGIPTTLEPLRLNGGLLDFGSDGSPTAWFIDDIVPLGSQATYNYASTGTTAMVRRLDPVTGSRVIYAAFGMESISGDWRYEDHPGNPVTHHICGLDHRSKMFSNISDYLRTGGVRGKIVGTDGVTPMGGMTVIARLGTGTNGAIMGSTVSLSDGTYLIQGLSAGDYAFFVQSAEFTADHRPVQRVFGGQITENADLTMRLLRFETAALYGTVTSPDGKPVPGATVTAQLASTGSNPLVVSDVTNLDGQYSIELPSGTYTVTASAPGYASATVTDIVIVAGADQRLDITLQSEPGELTGTISGEQGPVGGATVVLTAGGATVASTTTDAAGKYTVNISAGTYEIVVTAPGYEQGRQAGVVVTSGETTTADLTLSSVAPGQVSGLITIAGSNQPVSGVTISLLAGGATVRTVVSLAEATTAGGLTYNWRLDDVPAGTYEVRAQGAGFAAQTQSNIVVTSGRMTGGINFVLQPLHTFIAGLTMTSMPFDYTTTAPDAQQLFDDDPSRPLRLATWVTPRGSYAYYPNAPAKTFSLGRGYFMKLDSNQALTREGVRAATTGLGYEIPLPTGWNLIGAPYEFPVDLNTCQVITEGGAGTAVLDFPDAVARGLVGGTLYTLNFGAYQQVYRLDPYTGYWLRSYAPTGTTLKLRVPPRPLGGAVPPPAGRASRALPGEHQWQAQVIAKTAAGAEARVTFGVDRGAADVYDGRDRAVPPPPPIDGGAWLTLGFPHGDWGRFAGVYDTDLRSPTRRLRWELELGGAQAGEVVSLSWPELGASLPAGLRVVLEDLQTGLRRSLRHTTGYTLTSDGGTRRLALSVEPDEDRPAITALGYAATRGVGGEVRFTLSTELRATAVVRGLNGALVRTLLADEPLSAGPQAVRWDGRDEAGRLAPDGTYRLEVIARSETGEQVRAQATVTQRR